MHRGLGRTFGRDINAILGYIELNNKSVRDKAREYRDTYKMGRYEAIEEVLADMAGEGKASDLRGWDRLLAFLHDEEAAAEPDHRNDEADQADADARADGGEAVTQDRNVSTKHQCSSFVLVPSGTAPLEVGRVGYDGQCSSASELAI